MLYKVFQRHLELYEVTFYSEQTVSVFRTDERNFQLIIQILPLNYHFTQNKRVLRNTLLPVMKMSVKLFTYGILHQLGFRLEIKQRRRIRRRTKLRKDCLWKNGNRRESYL